MNQDLVKKFQGKQVYFHDRLKNEHDSGIYTVSEESLQAPHTGHVLLFRGKSQVWAKPSDIQLMGFENLQRVVLIRPEFPNEFKSCEVASLMLEVCKGAASEALEAAQEFKTRGYYTQEGCALMTYEHWMENYA